MPLMNGYSVYVSKGRDDAGQQRWTVRVYRDVDDEHVHSWERMESLACMDSVRRTIEADMAQRELEATHARAQ